MREQLEKELADLRHEAARLANYDLTIPGGRAATKFEALLRHERDLRGLLEKAGLEKAGQP